MRRRCLHNGSNRARVGIGGSAANHCNTSSGLSDQPIISQRDDINPYRMHRT